MLKKVCFDFGNFITPKTIVQCPRDIVQDKNMLPTINVHLGSEHAEHHSNYNSTIRELLCSVPRTFFCLDGFACAYVCHGNAAAR